MPVLPDTQTTLTSAQHLCQ